MKKMLALAAVVATSPAYAGGTARPSSISARGVGMGGAWTAWADDAAAIYFNPGALDTINSHVMLGAEYVVGPRKYTPLAADGSYGTPQTTTIKSPVPALGIVGRFNQDDQPSRWTLGLGVWNTFGGRVSYPRTGMPALDVTQDYCIEVNGGVGYHISDRLSIGAALRVGIGFFHIESTMNPFDANLSANGIGAGFTVGALFRPTDALRVGLTWRSPMRIDTTGSGSVLSAAGVPETHQVEHAQNWPQQVSLGLGRQVSPALKLAFQVDLDACTGCKACVTACHRLNGLDDDEGETWRSVGLLHGGTAEAPVQQTVTTACHHCLDPACMKGCPVGAYEKDPVTGIVRHLDDQCIGCQYCVLKCPYDVPKYNARLGIVRKCDMCHGRLAEGEAPACVQACPTQAIRIVTVATSAEATTRVDTSNFLAAAAIRSSSRKAPQPMTIWRLKGSVTGSIRAVSTNRTMTSGWVRCASQGCMLCGLGASRA